MTKYQHLMLIRNHLEGLAQTWWQSHITLEICIELNEDHSTSCTP
jgi:hypothetical protein